VTGCAFSEPARRDLIEIANYVASDDVAAALRLLEDFEVAAATLAEHPRIGVVRSDLAPEVVRLWRVGVYWIVYRSETTPLQIIRVVHAARDLERALRRDEGTAAEARHSV